MRTRVTDPGVIPIVSPSYNFTIYQGDPGGVPYYPWSYTPRYERIVDSPHRLYRRLSGGTRASVFKPVNHVRYNFVPQTANGVIQRDASWCLSTCANTLFGGNVDDQYLSFWQGCIPTQVGSTDAHWNIVRPSMSTRAGLAVFFYELRDVKRMFDLLPGKHFKLPSWEAVRYVNRQHLNYNFGWKPFIRDLTETWRGLATFDTRLKNFIAQANTDIRKHQASPSQSASGNKVITAFAGSNWDVSIDYSLESQVRSTFDFRYEIPPYSMEELRWRAVLDTLGLQISPRNIWAVIPWSFVIDWFANISKLLERAEDDWLMPWTTLIQSCTSIKISGSISVSLIWRTYQYPNQRLYAGYYTRSEYDRSLGGVGSTIATPTLNADKIRLLASLVGARFL